MTESQKRDANHLRWQESKGHLEFVLQGLNIGKWSTGKHCDGVAVVKHGKTVTCQKGGKKVATIGAKVMKLHHSIGQNTLTFLVEKIFFFKVDNCPKKKSLCPSIGPISHDVSSHLGA